MCSWAGMAVVLRPYLEPRVRTKPGRSTSNSRNPIKAGTEYVEIRFIGQRAALLGRCFEEGLYACERSTGESDALVNGDAMRTTAGGQAILLGCRLAMHWDLGAPWLSRLWQ